MEGRNVLGVVYFVCSCDPEKSAYCPSIVFQPKLKKKKKKNYPSDVTSKGSVRVFSTAVCERIEDRRVSCCCFLEVGTFPNPRIFSAFALSDNKHQRTLLKCQDVGTWN